MSVLRPDLMMKCVIPVIMAGIIAVRPVVQTSSTRLTPSQIYGLVVSVLISGERTWVSHSHMCRPAHRCLQSRCG